MTVQEDIYPIAAVVPPSIVNMLKLGSAKAFRYYAHDVFLPSVKSQLSKPNGWT